MLILNLVARDKDTKSEILTRIKSIFRTVFVKEIDQEVNEVVFALNSDLSTKEEFRTSCESNNKYINQCMSEDGSCLDEDLVEKMLKWKIT